MEDSTVEEGNTSASEAKIIYVRAQPNTVTSPIFCSKEYLPVFTGVDEDPEDFIWDVENSFEKQQWNIGDRELYHRQLRGAASKANFCYMSKDRSPAELYSWFISTFGP